MGNHYKKHIWAKYPIQIPTALYAPTMIETLGLTYCLHAQTNISKD